MQMFKSILISEDGQDMVEYVLILAFVAIAGAAALLGVGGDINTLWTIVNNRLAAAAH
jgi:Flp pilus assembly pilin Flp